MGTLGDVANESTRKFLTETGRPMLPKPYELRELLEVVSEMSGA